MQPQRDLRKGSLEQAGHEDVERGAAQHDRCQHQVVGDHDSAQEGRGQATRRRVAEVARQQRGHPVVGLHPAHEIAAITLAEERHGQAQDVAREQGRLLQGQPHLQAQQGKALQPAQRDVQDEGAGQSGKDRRQPAVVLLDQDIVDEHRGHAREDHAGDHQHDADPDDEGDHAV